MSAAHETPFCCHSRVAKSVFASKGGGYPQLIFTTFIHGPWSHLIPLLRGDPFSHVSLVWQISTDPLPLLLLQIFCFNYLGRTGGGQREKRLRARRECQMARKVRKNSRRLWPISINPCYARWISDCNWFFFKIVKLSVRFVGESW